MAEYPERVREGFINQFNQKPKYWFSCGGRFEILGNHTDHNHGLCIASTVDLAITAAVNKRKDSIVRIVSEGYTPFEIDLNDLEIKQEELGTSNGLVRGVARYFVDHKRKIGGFDAYTYSDIFKGAGVSSSAAFEVLTAFIFSSLYNGGRINHLELARAGQFAENKYFGKASGLLDQIGVAFGKVILIDFKNFSLPIIIKFPFPFKDIHFVIVNTGGSHAELNDLYSSIPNDMYSAAHKLNKEHLIDCQKEDIDAIKDQLTIMEYRRASHFFVENQNVRDAIEALENKDEYRFLEAINSSRISSTNNLQNMMVENHYEGSPLEACDYAMKVMENNGACKINGGGFAGSIICSVPDKYIKVFLEKMSEKYGENNVKEVFVREQGPRKGLYK